jgi:hypothetical protein
MSFLVTVPPGPLEDDALDDAFAAAVLGITGLGDDSLVRPRWQNPPPKTPEVDVDWCAVGVIAFSTPGYPYIEHVSGPSITDPSADEQQEHEELEVLASFYGPNAKSFAGILRSGFKIPQNLEPLKSQGLYFVEMLPQRVAPEFINQQWVRRVDAPFRFRRMVTRVYGINNILIADIHFFDDSGHVDETVIVPPGATIIP